MRQRITFLHKPEDAIDPGSLSIGEKDLSFAKLEAAREDKITLGFEELPQELRLVLKQSHELHIRYVRRQTYHAIPPILSRLSPGLHVYYSPQRIGSSSELLCPLLNKLFQPTDPRRCDSPEKSFTLLPAQRFQHSTAYEYYLPQSQFHQYSLVDYIRSSCPPADTNCQRRAQRLEDADSIDIDFDTISHALSISASWPSQIWDLNIASPNPQDRIEVGILSNEVPIELEELSMAGFLTVVGEDTKPSPVLFSFPARHHPKASSFSAKFLSPTGLHPALQLKISDSNPPEKHESCSLHAHLTLPRVIFPDKYQFSDDLFMAAKNLTTLRYVSTPIDLEAPEYAMSAWGSSLLLELAPPSPASKMWTAEIPLHLRYLPPTAGGIAEAEVPWPVLFWACTADEGSKFSGNPFDRVNLGYDGLFGPRTMFYHLAPEKVAVKAGRNEGYEVVDVPVLDTKYSAWVEPGTAAVILLGFGWVLWKLFVVWRTTGYGGFEKAKKVNSAKKKR